jgi:hypothetical protein
MNSLKQYKKAIYNAQAKFVNPAQFWPFEGPARPETHSRGFLRMDAHLCLRPGEVDRASLQSAGFSRSFSKQTLLRAFTY